jgi:hypothetical protein
MMSNLALTSKAGAPSLPTADGSGYPAQFLLGPSAAGLIASWPTRRVAGDLSLVTHPDLDCVQVRRGNKELTLVGHILDPMIPQATNEAILESLLDRFSDREALIGATAGYGGRWLIVAADRQERFLFHDALGLRQVFYTDTRARDRVWAMSQPGMARDVLGLEVDQEALAFAQSYAFRSHPEYRWPGQASPIHGTTHLLPNHWLDLARGTSQRYLPRAPLPAIDLTAAVERLAALLPGMIDAAFRRFELAISLTAGLDSRLVLAASKSVCNQVVFVSVRQHSMRDDHPDITVPARLLRRLGLPHEVIRADTAMTPEFDQFFRRVVHLAHEHYGPDAEAILRRFSRTKATLTGSGAEVGRCSFRKELPFSDIRTVTPANLARLQRMGREPFALRYFESWLNDAASRQNVKLLDLFEWEQGHGNWLAMTQLEFDIAWREIITPYNCRAVLTTMLGVDERYRRAPDYALFRQVIDRLWPEVLQEPINPHTHKTWLQYVRGELRSLRKYWS